MVNQQKPTKPKETAEETKFRKNLFPDIKVIKNKNLLCTSCGRSVKDLVAKGKPISHPFLDTLLCEKCSKFYGDGQFSEDEDGCDKYCRWCGQGGTLFLCSNCTAGFCKKCVKRNLPRSALQDIESDDWVCYCCNATPLFELRAQCWAANLYAAEHTKADKSSSSSKSSKKKRGREESTSDDEEKSKSKKKKTDEKNESKSTKDKSKPRKDESKSKSKSENGDDVGSSKRRSLRDKKEVKEELEEVDGVNKAQWDIVIKKFEDVTSDMAKVTKNMHKKCLEVRVKKVNTKHIHSFDSLDEVRKQVNQILTTLSDTTLKIKGTFNEFCEAWIKETKPNIGAETEPEEVKNSVENGIIEPIIKKEKDMDKDETHSISTLEIPTKPSSETLSKATTGGDDNPTDDLPKKIDNEPEENVSSDLITSTHEKMEVDSVDKPKEPKKNVNSPTKNNNEDTNNETNKIQTQAKTEDDKTPEKCITESESSQKLESVGSTPNKSTTPPKESVIPFKESVTPSKEITTSSKESITPSKEITTSSKESITPSKETTTSSKETTTSSNESANSPEKSTTPSKETPSTSDSAEISQS